MAEIKIDFFELAFLAEACIPPRPIARAMFWQRLINEIYHQLTDDERKRMFEWMNRNDNFRLEEEDCQWFYARFNPENQYEVSCFYKGKPQVVKAFWKDDLYRTSMTTHIDPQYIKSATKIKDHEPTQERD